ncbi:hypothetical protein D9M72_518190 [compost metagenome]
MADEIHRLDIGGETLAHAGADDLDRDLFGLAVAKHDGRMHLRDRGGRHRFGELGVEVLDLAAERTFDCGLRLALREGRHAVLQERQVGRELCADDIRARRQELTDLDIGGPEAGDRA